MATAPQQHAPSISRAHLVAALLDYDTPELEDGLLSSQSAASRSAVLAPFQHLLRPPPAVEQSPELNENYQGADDQPTALEGQQNSAERASSWSNRGSLDLLTNGRSMGGTVMGPEEQQDPEAEERLADEWGLGSHFSQLGSGSVPTSPIGSPMAMPTFPLPFPSNMVDEEEMEAIETKSMPDLDRPRALSGATDLDRSATTGGEDGGQPTRRVRILERRGSAARLRTQSLGNALQLPSFGDLPSFVDSAAPRASMDPLISLNARLSTYSTQANRQSVFSLADQTTADEPRVSSFARPRTSMSTHARPTSQFSMAPTLDPQLDYAAEEHPFDDTRPLSSLSMNPTTPTIFTSRFDPAMLAAARQEIEKERPIFANKTAGAPPSIVLMPAPLAGRPPSPRRKPRQEGPESEEEEEVEEELNEEGDATSQRPAGALYGRSLMDVMEERRTLLKGRARHYVAGNDGRRSMMDWGDSPAGQKLLAAQGLTVEGEAEGGEATTKLAGKRNKSAMSVFGPDVFYQRDLERMRILEAEEAKEREEEEAKEALVWEKERLKEEKKRSGKGKLLKAGRKSVDLSKAELAKGAGRSPPTSPQATAQAKGDTTMAPSLSLPTLDLTASTSTSWFPPSAAPKPPSSTSASNDDYRPPPVPERIPLNASNFAQKHSFSSDDSQQKTSNEHAAALRNAVMMGTLSPEAAAAEWHRLGLGSGSGSRSSGSDSRPLGERLTDPTSNPFFSSAAPPQLRVDLGSEEKGDWELSQYEQIREGAEEGGASPTGSDDDDVPLALRASMLHSRQVVEDEDDLPLGVRASMLSAQQDEDDRPLAFNVAQVNPYLQQQYQAEQFYLNQQRQSEVALFQQHQYNIAMQQQWGYGHAEMSGGPGSMVEKWRRGVEG